MSGNKLIKILFRFYSAILNEESTETMLAEIVDEEKGYFKLDNIPFYVPKIASGDIVWAEFKTSDGMLTYRKTIQYSGNSTIHVIMVNDKYEADLIRKIFENHGCRSDKANNYFALEIPAAMDYLPIKHKLDKLKSDLILDYSESCLSEKHQYQR
jgi:hypothetical protein